MRMHYCKYGSRYFDVIEHNFIDWVQKIKPELKENGNGQSYYACDLCKAKIEKNNGNDKLNRVFSIHIHGYISFCLHCWELNYKNYEVK